MPFPKHEDFPPAGWTIMKVEGHHFGGDAYYYAVKLNTIYRGPARTTYDEAFKDAIEGAYGYPLGS